MMKILFKKCKTDKGCFSEIQQVQIYILSSLFFYFLFIFLILIQSQFFYSQLALPQLIQSNMESQFLARSHLGLIFKLGSFSCTTVQVVTQSTQLQDCCFHLVLKPNHSKIQLPQQLDYRCMTPVNRLPLSFHITNDQVHSFFHTNQHCLRVLN